MFGFGIKIQFKHLIKVLIMHIHYQVGSALTESTSTEKALKKTKLSLSQKAGKKSRNKNLELKNYFQK